MNKPKSLSWFTKRIGKRIYRNECLCCPTCKEISEKGLIVHDKQHAEYLFTVQNDYGCEGFDLNYRDK